MNIPHKPKLPKKWPRGSSAVLVLVIWLGFIVALAYNRQGLSDWMHLRGYKPSTTVVSMATQDTMTGYARKVLYVNDPQIQPKTGFKDCNLGQEQAAILGCYHSNQAGIFVLQVSDNRLNGIEQVTTAHEMLHAAYDRLSSKQKKKVDAMLMDYYQHGLQDQTIKDQIASYKKTEPNDVVNEMHSVFGSEVPKLPPALEQYYKRYFTNRAAVTDFYASYQGEFTTRQTTIKNDDAQLGSMKKQIDTQQSTLQTQYTGIQAQQTKLNGFKQSGDVSDYNAGVPGYNTSVNAYNVQVDALKGLITQYNQLVTTRNGVALEAQQLTNEISSQPSSIDN